MQLAKTDIEAAHEISGAGESAPSLANPPARDRSWTTAVVITLLVAVVPAVMWPGAVSWMCDEPVLVSQAHYYNAAHRLARRGLAGTVEVPYGPLPTQIYQLLLLFTNDVRVLVAVRAFACSAMLAGSFLWLARTLRLTPWFAAAIMLAPYLWWSERVLWDASFALPIGALGVAAYASFLATRSGRSLVIAIAALTLVPFIHLQGLPLFAAFVGHAILRQPRAMLRNFIGVGLALLAIWLLNRDYIYLIKLVFVPKLDGIFHRGYVASGVGRLSFWVSLSGPFLGGRLFEGGHFVKHMNPLRGPPGWIYAAVLGSKLIIPLIWIGIATCAIGVIRRVKNWNANRTASVGSALADAFKDRATGNPAPTAQVPIRVRQGGPYETRFSSSAANGHVTTHDPAILAKSTIASLCLACLTMQIVLAVSLRVPPYPQYCFGTFPIHVLFAWFAIDMLQRFRIGILATLVWGLSLAFITLSSVWQIHRYGWDRYCMSPSLDNQIQMVQLLNRYSDEEVMTDLAMYKNYPMAIRCLRSILPPDPAKPRMHSPHGLLLRYAASPDPDSSLVELIEIPSDADVPPDAEEFDVTPWPLAYD